MGRDKRNIILLIIGFLFVTVLGVAFAYFTAFIGEGASADISASTDTVDSLMFEKGKDINIHATEDNFGRDENGNVKNLVESTYVRARLIPNNTNNYAKAKYNVYFVVDANDFVYTTDDEKPELILKIINPEGKEITELPGFTYYEDLGGFDITVKKSSMYAFKIASDYPIEANGGEEIQEWKIEVTLVNLPTSQNENGGRTFNGRIHITTDEKEVYKLYTINSISSKVIYGNIEATLNIDEGTNEVDKYYYSIEETDEEPSPVKINLLALDLERKYIKSDSPTITFKEDKNGEPLKPNTNYKIYSYIIDKAGYQSNIYSTVVKTDNYDLVQINDLEYTTTWNSISITGVKTTSGTGTAKEYNFKSNLDKEWRGWSTSPTYTINGLDEQTSVTVMVQVKDSNDRYSNHYEKVITTNAYDYPTITNFSISDITNNSMKVKFKVTKGLGELKKVEVQYNGEGETWHEAELTEGLYTVDFNSLNLGTKYDFKIKVTDEFKTKIYEDTIYTGTTQSTHTVSVTVVNGKVDVPSKDIIHGETETFTITPNPNYDITRATVTPEDRCKISSDGTLTVADVTEDISCNVNIPMYTIVDYIKNQFTDNVTQIASGSGMIYYHNEKTIGAQDDSYRYTGSNPNNFVCLGDTNKFGRCLNNDGEVGNDNLYRIIGIFPFSKDGVQQSNYSEGMEYRVKLIKSEYITKEELKGPGGTADTETINISDQYHRVKTVSGIHGFYWNSEENVVSLNGEDFTNLWEYDNKLATLNSYLNGYYLNTTLGNFKTNIADTKWHINGIESASNDIHGLMEDEMNIQGNSSSIPENGWLTTPTKIGLMYLSDYGFAVENINLIWEDANIRDYYRLEDNKKNNWMFNGINEWTIIRDDSRQDSAHGTVAGGLLIMNKVYNAYGVRPCFYLNSNVAFDLDKFSNEVDLYILTPGSENFPYTIKIN